MTRSVSDEVSATAINSEALPRRMEDSWDEPALHDEMQRVACAELQGAWFSIVGRRHAEFLFSGNHFTVRFNDGDIYMGVFDVNPAGQPRRMDMCIAEGPARHKGKTVPCIYEVDGTTLRWCAGNPGQRERLTAFPTPDDPHYLCLVFRRELPR